MTGPDAPRDPSPTPAGGSMFGRGPFMADLHRTPLALWIAVALMAVGFALLGGGVIALSISTPTAVVLLVAGVAVGIAGVVLAARRHIMSNVD